MVLTFLSLWFLWLINQSEVLRAKEILENTECSALCDRKMDEIWKNITGYEGVYAVSSKGRIKRIIGGSGICVAGKILKQFPNNRRYLQVTLCKNGEREQCCVHRLVVETFIGSCPEDMECRHLDGNSINNQLSNLKWGTKSDNERDKFLHGTDNCGIRNCNVKLTNAKVNKIRQLYATGKYTMRELAKEFNVTRPLIGYIINRIIWRHI